MYSRLIERCGEISDEQKVEQIVSKFGLSDTLARILLARGIDSLSKIEEFLHPSEKNLNDPFKLIGMNEAKERIEQAIEENETVVVYGDYDCDGICAAAILTKFLLSRGVNVFPYIPSRKTDGYGVSIDALERIIGDVLPDLIITCDCGISAKDEIEHCLDAGVDFIVTDHHEIPNDIPDCIIVNPKLPNQTYECTSLCGAGVVLKVVTAVGGFAEACKYLDLAALATIADYVPLIDENRTIVSLGLELMNSQKCINAGIIALRKNFDKLTSTDIAYRIAPRINAAGRMGDAHRAYDLLMSEDSQEVESILVEIDKDNDARREDTAKIYEDVKRQISLKDLANTRAYVLSSKNWNKGITSIVAAQVVGDYSRPTFICVGESDCMKGTSRSIDGVNIYDVLAFCKDLLLEFGGHAQAAGFSIKKENIAAFEKKVNEFLLSNYDDSVFLPKTYYDLEIDESKVTLALAKEISKLEPFGSGFVRPCFRIKLCSPKFERGNKPQHLITRVGQSNAYIFNASQYQSILNIGADYETVVELSVNSFQSKDYLNVNIKGFDISEVQVFEELKERLLASELLIFGNAQVVHTTKVITFDTVKEILAKNAFGTLLVCYSVNAFLRASKLLGQGLQKSVLVRGNYSNQNRIVLAPTFEFDGLGYTNIIQMDNTIDEHILPFETEPNANVFCLRAGSRSNSLGLTCERLILVNTYKEILNASKQGIGGQDVLSALFSLFEKDKFAQSVVCFAILQSLGIVCWRDNNFHVDTSQRCDLDSSAGYRLLKEIVV